MLLVRRGWWLWSCLSTRLSRRVSRFARPKGSFLLDRRIRARASDRKPGVWQMIWPDEVSETGATDS